jgi:hypothetical protein
MSQLALLFETRCDVAPGVVVTGVLTGGVVVAGVVVSEDDELDAAPPDAGAMPVLADDDGDALVVLVVALVAVVDVELVEVVLPTLAASNGSRL